MRTTHRASRLVRSCVALAATGLLSLGGVWVRAQEGVPAAELPVAVDREQVPSLRELQATLTRLRRDTTGTGGPALEHAALALGRARTAESAAAEARAGADDEALRARRIAYAALTLAEAQRDRERARLARDAAAEARHQAEGSERTAREALRVARANAAALNAAGQQPEPEPGAPTQAAVPAGDTP